MADEENTEFTSIFDLTPEQQQQRLAEIHDLLLNAARKSDLARIERGDFDE